MTLDHRRYICVGDRRCCEHEDCLVESPTLTPHPLAVLPMHWICSSRTSWHWKQLIHPTRETRKWLGIWRVIKL
jgi:hypothetical protein